MMNVLVACDFIIKLLRRRLDVKPYWFEGAKY